MVGVVVVRLAHAETACGPPVCKRVAVVREKVLLLARQGEILTLESAPSIHYLILHVQS